MQTSVVSSDEATTVARRYIRVFKELYSQLHLKNGRFCL